MVHWSLLNGIIRYSHRTLDNCQFISSQFVVHKLQLTTINTKLSEFYNFFKISVCTFH